ncbi:MAG: transporter [Myxococcales bacterium]|nr:transporter [Myxococcales bacterium]
MTRRLLIVAVVSLSWLLAAAPVEARPYRLLVARSPASTGAGNLEIGARYQGLYLGNGRDATAGLAAIDPGNLHQISASVRWGIISQLELGFELSGVIFHNPASGETEGAFGDIIATLQGRILSLKRHRLGLFVGFAFPTGPSDVDALPPFWADGTFDVTALLLYELAPTRRFRLVLNAGYNHNGKRDRGDTLPSFDVPDAFIWDIGAAVHFGRRVLAFAELSGRHYFRADVTPVWVDNAHIVELRPSLRVETIPRLVLEVGFGIALTPAAHDMYILRALVGMTYEFSIY